MPVFWPVTGDMLFLDGNMNGNFVALFLIFLVAMLLWNLFAVRNGVRRAMFLRNIFAVRNSDRAAFLFRHLFGNIDVSALLIGNLMGNINVFARFRWDLFTFLLVIVARFAFFGVGGVAFLFLCVFSFVDGLTLLLLFIFGFVDSLAFLFLLVSTFLLVRSFTVLLLLVSTFLLVFGDALGDFDFVALFVVFCFVFSCVRLVLFLAFPVFFLGGNVVFDVVALLFGDLFALLLRNFVALGHSDFVALFFSLLGMHRDIDGLTLLGGHLMRNINVFALLIGNLVGNIDRFARLRRDLFTFLLVVVARFAFFGVGSVALLFLGVFCFVNSLTFLFLCVFGFVDGLTFLFLFVVGYSFVDSVTFLFLFVVAVLFVDGFALCFVVMFTFLFLFSFTRLGVVVTAVTSFEQVKEKRCGSSLGRGNSSSLRSSLGKSASHKAQKKEDLHG